MSIADIANITVYVLIAVVGGMLAFDFLKTELASKKNSQKETKEKQ